MHPGFSVLLRAVPVDGVPGEFAACGSIDVQTPHHAPGAEVLRIDVSTMPRDAARVAMADGLLGAFLPMLERGGQKLAVLHEVEDRGIILATIPRDADGIGQGSEVGHAVSPSACDLSAAEGADGARARRLTGISRRASMMADRGDAKRADLTGIQPARRAHPTQTEAAAREAFP